MGGQDGAFNEFPRVKGSSRTIRSFSKYLAIVFQKHSLIFSLVYRRVAGD
jgi:hypothetical protein